MSYSSIYVFLNAGREDNPIRKAITVDNEITGYHIDPDVYLYQKNINLISFYQTPNNDW